MMDVQMVDLRSQYLRHKQEFDAAMQEVLQNTSFINGAAVKLFSERLAAYLDVPYVVPCGNGTDALRIALQSLGIGAENDVIVPAFTYIAPVEAVAAVGASPILVDVDAKTFNVDCLNIEKAITSRTKAIIAVHLFGQSCDMEPILKIAKKYNLYVIEDNAQSLGASYTFSDGSQRKLGTIGTVGTTSFFPTKPLACYGDGGAMFTSDAGLAEKMRMMANHGQLEKYHHYIVGTNSRLDTLQAAILNVKMNYMDEFSAKREEVAKVYDRTLKSCPDLLLPERSPFSTHLYHQYTIQVQNGKRDALKAFLAKNKIPSMIYYPLPVNEQAGYKWLARISGSLQETKRLCGEVLSLPIHSEMEPETQTFIIETIGRFFYGS